MSVSSVSSGSPASLESPAGYETRGNQDVSLSYGLGLLWQVSVARVVEDASALATRAPTAIRTQRAQPPQLQRRVDDSETVDPLWLAIPIAPHCRHCDLSLVLPFILVKVEDGELVSRENV